MKFSERLYKLRKKEGLSQEELAEKLDVTRQTISKWELGVSTPEMEKLIQISNFFGISVDELVSESEENNVKKNDTKNYSSYTQNVSSNVNEGSVNDSKNSKSSVKMYVILGIVLGILIIIPVALLFSKFIKMANNTKDIVSETMGSFTEKRDDAKNEFETKVKQSINSTFNDNMINSNTINEQINTFFD